MLVKVKKLFESSILPTRMTNGSAGFDLYACVQHPFAILPKGGVSLIPTGIAIQLPEGYEAQLRPRSGLAMKNFVTILNTPATIDSDYRGEVKVLLINHGKDEFYVENGMRIAQLIISKYESAEFEVVSELDVTERNGNGFGSTGTR